MTKPDNIIDVDEIIARVKARHADSSKPNGGSEQDTKGKDEQWREGMISARELCSMRFAPLKFIVPKIIPEGLTILAGRPKIGKSWLVLLLGIVLANGVKALGLDYELALPLKGSVLYLGLEDGRRRLQRRMTKLVGLRAEHWPEQLYLKTKWRRFDQGGLDDIRAWHEHSKAMGEIPVLVVVDTLAKIRAAGNSKNSPYQNDHDALAGLQMLAEELGIGVVVNHHDRKMDADDVFDTVSGTLGLTGAVDTILVLTRKAGATTLHFRGRDLEDEDSLAMQFNKDTGRWSVIGTIAEREEATRSEERSRILAALADAKDGLAVPEIMIAAELSSRNATDQLLFRMAAAREVERVKRGLYGLPGTRDRMKRVRSVRSVRSAEKPLTQQEDSQSYAILPAGNLTDTERLGNPLNPQGNGERSYESYGSFPSSDKTHESGASGTASPPQGDSEPGQVTVEAWIKVIRPPGLGPPGDDLNDIDLSWRQ